ncbi:MAG TPA: hypothetical protein VLE48_03105 [Terriglobales bacterium]|nr:hypothetical protein [Terriglobales bacterium]
MSSTHSNLFVTLHGIPLRIELRWPFHRATSGADFYVLHGAVNLEDGSGLKAQASANLTLTLAEELPSLEPVHAESLVVNAIRKTVDNGQLEFLKSAKLQPVEVSTRYYSFREKIVRFPAQKEEDVRGLLRRKVYWLGVRLGAPTVWLADPHDASYVNHPVEKLLQLAAPLAADGLIRLEGEYATPTDALAAMQETFQHELQAGLARTKAQFNPSMVTS